MELVKQLLDSLFLHSCETVVFFRFLLMSLAFILAADGIRIVWIKQAERLQFQPREPHPMVLAHDESLHFGTAATDSEALKSL